MAADDYSTFSSLEQIREPFMFNKTKRSSTIYTELPTINIDFEDNFSETHLSNRSATSTKSLCRICQSETGVLIRPCACDGTMGKIHENCLNEWVVRSRKNCCEICKAEYAKSGNVLLPLRQWTRPEIDIINVLEVITLLGLGYSTIYMALLSVERQFFERTYNHNLPPTDLDLCRLLIFTFLSACFSGTLCMILQRICFYMEKQRKVQFINRVDSAKERTVNDELSNTEFNVINCS